MNVFLATVLILIYFLIIIWGLLKRERIYQYPFLVSMFSLVFLGPQIIALLNNPGEFVPDSAISRVLLMGCFCAIASWLGYLIPIPKKWLSKAPIKLNQNRLQSIATFYVIVGIIFNFLLFYLPNGNSIGITGQSSGIVTIYIFAMRGFLYVGFPIILMKALVKNTPLNFFLIAFSLCVPFYHAIFLGRRSSAFLLIISIGLSLYFVRRMLPWRSLAIGGIVFALIMNLNIKDYRNILVSGDWKQINNIDYIENANDFLAHGKTLELRNGALLTDLTAKTGRLGWGSLYWDNLVFRFVPGQLIGRDFKKKFQIKNSIEGEHLFSAYGYHKPLGTTPTGIAEAFTQFDYFGAILFALSGFLCKFLYLRSLVWKTALSRVLYINILQNSVLDTVVIGHSWFICAAFTLIIFALPLIILCRQGSSYRNLSYLGS